MLWQIENAVHFNVQGITYKMWQEDEQLKTGSTQMSQRRALITENEWVFVTLYITNLIVEHLETSE